MKAAESHFTLCDYFNEQGVRIERFYITSEPGEEAVERVRAMKSGEFERLLDAMFADAASSGVATDPDDAALALNILLHEVAEYRWALVSARKVASIGINLRKPLPIAEIVPALEMGFGGYSVSWAQGIFRHLNLGTPHLQ